MIPSYFLHIGRAFRIVARTSGAGYVDEANAIMSAQPGVGLLHADEQNKVAILANNSDEGRPVGDVGGIRSLECCCCGNGLRGRQWHNRDTGYGLCADCVDYCARGETVESFERCYGLRGVHFDTQPAATIHDAARIVACVNYCSGVSTDKLLSATAAGGLYALWRADGNLAVKAENLRAQRDELLTALKWLCPPAGDESPAAKAARAAIAKVQP